MASPAPRSDHEQLLFTLLVTQKGRVVARRKLARDLGFAQSQSRRVDAMLVNVRRELSSQGMELVNVRSRGWMVAEASNDAASNDAATR